MWNPKIAIGSTVSVVVTLVACGSDRQLTNGTRRAPADAIPPQIVVEEHDVEEGTALGYLRKASHVARFAISETPTTVAQYRRCVADGACASPELKVGACQGSRGLEGATYSVAGAEDAPVTCASPEQARAYCAWVGGRLPRPSEFLLAARGAAPHRFAWGDDRPSCERAHRLSWFPAAPMDCCDSNCEVPSAVRTRPKGNSVTGLADVMTTNGEIVDTDPQTVFPGCATNAKACVVTGLLPGAIDHVSAFPEPARAKGPFSHVFASGFRCVWEGGSR